MEIRWENNLHEMADNADEIKEDINNIARIALSLEQAENNLQYYISRRNLPLSVYSGRDFVGITFNQLTYCMIFE